MDAPTEIVSELEKQGVAPGSYDFVPLDGLRKLIARRMVDAVQSIPHFAVDMRVELDSLLALRNTLNSQSDIRVSVNDLVIKAAALALMRVPAINASFTPVGIVRHHNADIAFAVAMDGGLVTPVVRAAQDKPIEAIARETKDLAERGRIKRLKPQEYSGGSFSISNLGMFGVARFDTIINQPQGAILSVAAAEVLYLPGPAGPRAATVMTATLTSDHRIIDGAVAAAWLTVFKALIEEPEQLLGQTFETSLSTAL